MSDTIIGEGQLACLESFPNELKRLVIYNLDDVSLRKLIHSSPSFRQVYLHERAFIFRGVDSVLVAQALNAHEAANVWAVDPPLETEDDRKLLVRNFMKRLTTWTVGDNIMPIFSCQQLFAAARVHQIVESIAIHYMRWAWNASVLPQNPTISAVQDIPLSPTEKFRIYRALYNTQIFCYLFGDRRYSIQIEEPFFLPGPLADPHYWNPSEIGPLYFRRFAFWETEEITCINEYMISSYTPILKECENDLSRESPRFADARDIYTPEGSFEVFQDSPHYRDHRDSLISNGLIVFSEILNAQSHEERVELVAGAISYCGSASLHGLLNQLPGELYGDDLKYPKNMKTFDIPAFTNDSIPLGAPNKACSWAVKLDPRFPYNSPRTTGLRRWGYVMWDAFRLDAAGLDDNTVF